MSRAGRGTTSRHSIETDGGEQHTMRCQAGAPPIIASWISMVAAFVTVHNVVGWRGGACTHGARAVFGSRNRPPAVTDACRTRSTNQSRLRLARDLLLEASHLNYQGTSSPARRERARLRASGGCIGGDTRWTRDSRLPLGVSPARGPLSVGTGDEASGHGNRFTPGQQLGQEHRRRHRRLRRRLRLHGLNEVDVEPIEAICGLDFEAVGVVPDGGVREAGGTVVGDAFLPRDARNGVRKREREDDVEDERFMRMALRLAERAGRDDEVPVGAVLTETVAGSDGRRRVLATGRNEVERRADASAHAEMLCLQAASKVRQNWRLAGATLYVTMEPCVMCLSAAQLFRVDRVVYGASSPNLGACGGWVDLPARKHAFHELEVQGGVLAEECAVPLRGFFRSRRREGVALSSRSAVPGRDPVMDTPLVEAGGDAAIVGVDEAVDAENPCMAVVGVAS